MKITVRAFLDSMHGMSLLIGRSMPINAALVAHRTYSEYKQTQAVIKSNIARVYDCYSTRVEGKIIIPPEKLQDFHKAYTTLMDTEIDITPFKCDCAELDLSDHEKAAIAALTER